MVFLMRFVARTSRLYSGVLLVVLLAFGAGVGLVASRMPLFVVVGFGVLIGLGLLAMLSQLLSCKPRLQIDEEGIRCYQAFYDPISWDDVVAAERVPLVEKQQIGSRVRYNRSFCDAWRPIDLDVRRLDKYSKLIPAGLHNLLSDGFRKKEDPEVFRLRLELSGLAGSSARALEVIQYHLARTAARS